MDRRLPGCCWPRRRAWEATTGAIDQLYQGSLDDNGFDVERQTIGRTDGSIVLLSGSNSEADVLITMSIEEVSNVGDQVTRATTISLTWAPAG